MTDVRLRDVHALPAGRTDQRVVVQRRNGRNPARASHSRQVEREIQQVVYVKDLRPRGIENVSQLGRHASGCVGVLEAIRLPVVDDLDDRESLVRTPADGAVARCRIVLGRDDEHVVAAGQLATQLERVDLRAGDVPRQKIVDRVEEPQPGHSPLPRAARASC